MQYQGFSHENNAMALKFTSSITSRVSTVNVERQLMHAFLYDKISLQRTIGKHRSEFFTSTSRQFIYDCIRQEFDDHRMTLSREKFAFDVQKRYDSGRDKDRIADIEAEFELVHKTELTGDVEQIIHDLEDVQLANATDGLIRESYKLLEQGKYEEAADVLRRKSIDLNGAKQEHRVINLHRDSDDWFQEVRNRREHPEQYAGVPTGFKRFDEKTGGLFPAELTIVFGLSGKGKSTFMKALACNIRKQGRVVLHCGNEENEFQMRSKYMSADSGEKYSPFKRGTYTDKEYERLKIYSDNARGVGAIYIYEFPQQTDATWIERAVHFLEMNGVHVDVIVVDYLDLMKPIGTAYSENDEGGKITSDLKQLAINCNCPVVTATQAGIQSEKQEKKAKPFLNASDVFGTKRKVHSANTLIGIVNQTATAMAQELPEEQRRMHHMVLCVPKNRDGGVFTFRQVMDAECGQFYEDTDPDNPALKNLEQQAMQMIDDTAADPKSMRSEIDVNEIQKAVADDFRKKLQVIEKDIAAGNTLKSAAPAAGAKQEFDADARAREDAKYADEDDSINSMKDDDPLLGNAPAPSPGASALQPRQPEENPMNEQNSDAFLNEPDTPVPPEYSSSSSEEPMRDRYHDDFIGDAEPHDDPTIQFDPAPEPPRTAYPEGSRDYFHGEFMNAAEPAGTDPSSGNPEPRDRYHDGFTGDGQSPAPPEEAPKPPKEPAPEPPRAAYPEGSRDYFHGEFMNAPAIPQYKSAAEPSPAPVYTADDMDTSPVLPFDIGHPKPAEESAPHTPPPIPRKKSFADILAEKKRQREQQGGANR